MATKKSTTTTSFSPNISTPNINYGWNILNYTTKVEDKFVPIVKTKDLNANTFESQFGKVQTQDTSWNYTTEAPITPSKAPKPNLSISQEDVGFFGEGWSDWLLDEKSKPLNFFNIPSYKAKSLEAMDEMIKIRNSWKVDDSLRKIVGESKFNDIKAFRNRIDITSQMLLNEIAEKWTKWEWHYESFVSWQWGNAAIVWDIPSEYISRWVSYLHKVTWIDENVATFRETEQAKRELASKGKYELWNNMRTAGAVQEMFAWYGAFGKVVDRTLLATKIPASAWLTWVIGREIQAWLKTQYVNNPKLFNFISNSAQETIEYGVKKSIDPDSTSLGQLTAWVAAWGVFSQFSSPWKSLQWIASTRDYKAFASHLNDIKTKMPDITDDELLQFIQNYKFKDMGMTVREVWEIISKRAKDSDWVVKTTWEVLQNHLAEGWIYVTNWASNRLNAVLDYANDSILKDSKWNKATEWFDVSTNFDNGDIVWFKWELMSSLKSGVANTLEDVNKLVDELGKKYWVSVGNKWKDISDMDSIEEALLKPNASMSNIANPKTFDNLLTQFWYTPTPKVDLEKVKDLDVKATDLNSKASRTADQSEKLTSILRELEWIYSQFGINPSSKNAVGKLENAIYKVPKWVYWKTRDNYIKWVKEELVKLNEWMELMAGKRSVTQEGEVNRIFANTKIAKLLGSESNNYLSDLKKANTIMEDIKSWNDSVYFSNKKIREAQYAKTREKILSELPTTWFYEINDWIKLSLKEGEALINWGVVDKLNTPYRVLGNALGYDSTAFKELVENPMMAESNWINEGDKLIGDINDMMIKWGLENKDSHKKFVMWMLSRRFDWKPWEVDPRESMINARNLRKDSKGNLVNMLEWPYKGKDAAIRLTIEDVNRFVKEGEALVKNNPELQKLVSYLDKEFEKNAEKFNEFAKEDGDILSTTKHYFPVKKYKVGERIDDEELTWVNFDTMRAKFLDSWFLVDLKRAQKPDDFNLELDMGNIMNWYKNNQLYYLHMKPQVDRMSKITWTSLGNKIQIAEDWAVVDITWAFWPNIQKYIWTHIDNIKNRGTSKVDETSRYINRALSWVVSYLNIWFNVFSAAAQPLSLVDNALFHANTLDSIGRAMRADPNEAMEVSWMLRQRMTEHISWLAERKWFDMSNPLATIGSMVSNKDIQSIGLYGKDWRQSLLDTSLRWMKRVDWATSTVAWYSWFYDKLAKDFPELKWTETSLKEIRERIWDVAFTRIRNYADGQMNNVMYQGSSIVNKQQITVMGAFYWLNTLLMKTMLNRSFLLNDAWRNSTVWKNTTVWKLRQLSLVWMGYALEETRKYTQQQVSVEVWDKEKYAYYDGLLVWVWDDLVWWKLSETNPNVRYFLNAFGWFISNYIWWASPWYDPYAMFKKSTDAWNFYRNDFKWIPVNRQIRWVWEAVTQNLLPWSMKLAVPIIHKDITWEDRFKQKNDDKELSYILRTNPEKYSIVNQMSFAEQANQARMSKEGNAAEKIVSDRNAIAKKKVDDLMKEVYSLYWVPTKDELRYFAWRNLNRFKEAWISKNNQLDAFIKSAEEFKIRISTWEESYIPKNIEAIYENKIKKMAEAKDVKWMNDYIRKLHSDWVIKDLDWTRNKVKSFLKRDKLLWYK